MKAAAASDWGSALALSALARASDLGCCELVFETALVVADGVVVGAVVADGVVGAVVVGAVVVGAVVGAVVVLGVLVAVGAGLVVTVADGVGVSAKAAPGTRRAAAAASVSTPTARVLEGRSCMVPLGKRAVS